MKRRRRAFKTVIAPIVVIVAIIPTLTTAVWEVLHGRGAAVYTNVYGLAIHYTSVLIMVAALIFALVVAYIARLFYFWRYGHGRVTELRELQLRTPYTDPGDSK
jgi:uncharacterized membrane protein YwaF